MMPTIGGSTPAMGAEKKELNCDTQDTERSSISTTSSATSSSNGHEGSKWTSNSANKLSKFGRRIRDSCRNLKGKQHQNGKSNGTQHSPEDYSSFQLPNESVRSKVYVAMDFSGRQEGRILDNPRDVRTCDKVSTATKDGYVPFKRRIAAPVADRLTETQAKVHKYQAWYHGGLTRDKANKILQAHANTDGVFLVRESSVAGGFVISYTVSHKNVHSQVLPMSTAEGVVYSIDDGKTKFYDLLQLVEFYQLNSGILPTRLNHYIANMDCPTSPTTERKGVESDLWATPGGAPGTGTLPAPSHSPVLRTGSSSVESNSSSSNSEACKFTGAEEDDLEGGGGGSWSQSPDSVKIVSSASEVDSALSQDGVSEEGANNWEQRG